MFLDSHGCCEENEDHWSSQIIYTLDICTSRMSHRPSEENANQHSLKLLAAEKFDFGLGAININFDLLKVKSLVARHVFNLVSQVLHCCIHGRAFEVVAHHAYVLFAFARNSVILNLLVDRNIVTQEAPYCATNVWYA